MLVLKQSFRCRAVTDCFFEAFFDSIGGTEVAKEPVGGARKAFRSIE